MGDVKSISDVLGTEDQAEQVEILSQLVRMAQAPVATMTAILDFRTNKVQVILDRDYTFEQVYQFLDALRKEVMRKERESILEQKDK